MNILLVEDNKADAYLLMEFLKAHTRLKVNWVTDGCDALDFVAKSGQFVNADRPDVILLDLGLPRISGYEALRELKINSDHKNIPIIVLTTSCSALDQQQCGELGANAFFSKPRNLKGYEELIERLLQTELPRLVAA